MTGTQSYLVGDYSETYQTFKPIKPDRYNWAYEIFDKWSDDPDHVAMFWVSDTGESKEITYREFTERSKRLANALSGIGAQPGDRVLTMMHRVPEWWEIVLASCLLYTSPSPRDRG